MFICQSFYLFYLSIYFIYVSNAKSQVFLFLNDMWPKNGPNFSLVEILRRKLFTSSRFSWGGVQPGCWVVHHPGQWWHRRGVCSTLRHCGWPVEYVLGWFLFSCCHGQRCQQITMKLLHHQQEDVPWSIGHCFAHGRTVGWCCIHCSWGV